MEDAFECGEYGNRPCFPPPGPKIREWGGSAAGPWARGFPLYLRLTMHVAPGWVSRLGPPPLLPATPGPSASCVGSGEAGADATQGCPVWDAGQRLAVSQAQMPAWAPVPGAASPLGRQ